MDEMKEKINFQQNYVNTDQQGLSKNNENEKTPKGEGNPTQQKMKETSEYNADNNVTNHNFDEILKQNHSISKHEHPKMLQKIKEKAKKMLEFGEGGVRRSDFEDFFKDCRQKVIEDTYKNAYSAFDEVCGDLKNYGYDSDVLATVKKDLITENNVKINDGSFQFTSSIREFAKGRANELKKQKAMEQAHSAVDGLCKELKIEENYDSYILAKVKEELIKENQYDIKYGSFKLTPSMSEFAIKRAKELWKEKPVLKLDFQEVKKKFSDACGDQMSNQLMDILEINKRKDELPWKMDDWIKTAEDFGELYRTLDPGGEGGFGPNVCKQVMQEIIEQNKDAIHKGTFKMNEELRGSAYEKAEHLDRLENCSNSDLEKLYKELANSCDLKISNQLMDIMEGTPAINNGSLKLTKEVRECWIETGKTLGTFYKGLEKYGPDISRQVIKEVIMANKDAINKGLFIRDKDWYTTDEDWESAFTERAEFLYNKSLKAK